MSATRRIDRLESAGISRVRRVPSHCDRKVPTVDSRSLVGAGDRDSRAGPPPSTTLRVVPPPDKREGKSTAGFAGTEGSVGLPPLYGEGGPAQPVGGVPHAPKVTRDPLKNVCRINLLDHPHPDLSPRFPAALFYPCAHRLPRCTDEVQVSAVGAGRSRFAGSSLRVAGQLDSSAA